MVEVQSPPEAQRALVVEDEPAWQQILSEILRDSGLDVDVAGTVDEAVLLLRQSSHRLAVVDLALGEGFAANRDGLRVLQAIQCQDPRCASLLLTGYATVELAVAVLNDYGALSCLEKARFNRAEFQRLVHHALATPTLFDRAVERSERVISRLDHTAGGELTVLSSTILVVEDDASWRSILAELLSEAGYHVRLCNSFGEAAGCLRREPYDLAIVDLSLEAATWTLTGTRDFDGYRLLAQAREQGVVTLVVSGVGSPQDIACAYETYDVFACLEKQAFDRRSFLQTVGAAIAASEKRRALHDLTPREVEVLTLLAQGFTNKEIAELLVISANTVKRHLKSVFDKLGVHTRAAATARAISAGLSPRETPAVQ